MKLSLSFMPVIINTKLRPVFCLLVMMEFTTGLIAQKGRLFSETFDNPKKFSGGWTAAECATEKNLRIITAPTRAGRKALQVTLRKSDKESQFGNKRTELTYNNFNNPEDIDTSLQWWGFSNYFPATYGPDPAEEIIVQWHDKSPNCSASPTLAIEIKDDRFRAMVRYSTEDYCVNRNSIVLKTFDLGPVIKSKWIDWTIYYHPQTNLSGVIEIWMDGNSVLRYEGPCQYIGSYFPYFKIGLYKWSWMPDWKGIQSRQSERIYYLDEIMAASQQSMLKKLPAKKTK